MGDCKFASGPLREKLKSLMAKGKNMIILNMDKIKYNCAGQRYLATGSSKSPVAIGETAFGCH